jgi:hypothetical protein
MLLFTLNLAGCDDEPSCSLRTSISGSFVGALDWSREGRQNCGVTEPAAIDPSGSVIVFVDRSTGVKQRLFVTFHSPVPSVGVHEARVLFAVADVVWDSGPNACVAEVVDFAIEDWTLLDFVRLRGRVVCPNPLTSPDLDPIVMTELNFAAHLHDERIPINAF